MSRLINPYQVFLGTTGQVLSNGTLEFYENESTTAKPYYSDADLTTTGGTSYTLDGYGRVTGNVWLDGEYRIIVKNSAGATQYTIDDVSSVTSAGGGGSGETVQGDTKNKFINGACRVYSDGGSVSISGTYQESAVHGIYVKADGTPTNGTLDRVKTTLVGTSGYAEKVTSLTTGGGGMVYRRFRFNSVDSRDLVSAGAVFQCNVFQNTGVSVTYTISIYKANAEDDFSGTTLISASSGTSVSDLTDTIISHAVSDMGDCSNGIEIVVSAACGAVTTKDFYTADIVFRRGISQIVFEQDPYQQEFASLKFSGAFPPEYLSSSLTIEKDTGADPNTDFKIKAGNCKDSTGTFDIRLQTDITKQIDNVWAAGDDAGGRPSAVTLSGPEWLYVFLIAKADGTVDAGIDDNLTATNLLAAASGYTYYRHVASILTNSSNQIDLPMANVDIGKKLFTRYVTTTGANTFLWPPLVRALKTRACGGGGQGDGGTAQNGGDTTVTYNSVSAVAGGGLGSSGAQAGGQPSGSYDFGMPGQGVSNNGWGGDCPLFGCGGKPRNVNTDTAGYGGGGGGSTTTVYAGTGAAMIEKTFEYVAGQETVSITIGAGGSTGSGGEGGDGCCVVTW